MMLCLTDIDDFDDIQAEDLPEEVENPFDFFEDDYWDHYFEADSVIFHLDVMRVVTDDAAQAQAICDILNAHKGEWQ